MFIVFTMPSRYSAQGRSLLGGYAIGIIIGIIMSLISKFLLNNYFSGQEHNIYIIFGALAVGVAIFLMVITDTEHPPAIGLALGLVLSDWTYRVIVMVVVSVLLLYGIKKILKPYLIDLR